MDDERLVKVAVYEGEPLARLAEQRLLDAGVASVVRTIGPGPGGWGVAASLPYALYVQARDKELAQEVLEQGEATSVERPSPPEEALLAEAGPQRTASRRSVVVSVILFILVAALLIGVVESLLPRLFR
ncbi:MAG: hypothetical protein HY683_07480 [Chloroflexi bacterium]|nr:hypothetical protein [Chloroflexota bacterium]